MVVIIPGSVTSEGLLTVVVIIPGSVTSEGLLTMVVIIPGSVTSEGLTVRHHATGSRARDKVKRVVINTGLGSHLMGYL